MSVAVDMRRQIMAEERGAYHTANEPEMGAGQPDNVRVLPTRGRFTQVDNAYFDGLFGRVSPTAYACLMYVVRNTLGYHRESVRLSFKQVGDALDISRNTAMRGLQELEAARIIGSDDTERGRTQVHTFRLLPLDGWTLTPRTQTSANIGLDETSAENELAPTSPNTALVVSKIGLVCPTTSPKIEQHINKEKESKKETSSCPTPDGADVASESSSKPKPRTAKPKPLAADSEALRLAAYLRDRILAHSPNARDAKQALASAKLANWARPIDLMLRRDERTPDAVRAVIDFATTDSFWHSNILSPGKLRDQYDTLEAQMRSRSRPRPTYSSRASQPEPPSRPMRSVPPVNAKPAQLD